MDTDLILDFIIENPGVRSEKIMKSLSMTKAMVHRRMTILSKNGKIHSVRKNRMVFWYASEVKDESYVIQKTLGRVREISSLFS